MTSGHSDSSSRFCASALLRLIFLSGSAFLLCLFYVAAALAEARAENWQATLWNVGLPQHLVAVDKQRKTFFLYEKKNPLQARYAFPCTTGQLDGDKQSLNDLRTPEGIYFVEYKIAKGLDFKEYGGVAYTLNYPNPVDRLRGKTGHGIWIHSKGYGLVPTRGCVAIGLKEIDTVGPSLTPGTAVVLAEQMDQAKLPRRDTGTARELRRLMQSWSNAWSARSSKMFDFYDQAAYSVATENFAAFRANKERLFKILSYVKLFNRDIHVLEGPGYWVTWSEQFYTASNLCTEGVRRLYWQRGKDNRFRIVGMEWTPRDLGMKAEYLKGRLVAENASFATDAASEAPVPPRLDMPESADEKPAPKPAAEDGRGKLVAANEPLVPRSRPPALPPAEVNWGTKPSLDSSLSAPSAQAEPSAPAAPAASQPSAPGNPVSAPVDLPAAPETAADAPVAPQKPEAQQPKPAEPPKPDPPKKPAGPEPLVLDDTLRAAVSEQSARYDKALAARQAVPADLFDEKNYNRLPGVPRGRSFRGMQQQLQEVIRQPWLRVITRPAEVSVENNLAVSRTPQLVAGPRGMVQGERILWWNRCEDGMFRIVASDFRQAEKGLSADYLELISEEVNNDIEEWRKAWLAADLDGYMAAYAKDAVQQNRVSAAAIRAQKKLLWERVRPVEVQLTGLRVMPERNGVRADMMQAYADTAGKRDRGVKSLLLRYDGAHWRIQREDWKAQPN